MSKAGLLTIVGIAVLSLLVLVYLAITWDAPEGTTTVVIDPPAPAPPAAPTANTNTSSPSSSVLPQIRIQPQQQPAPPAAEPTVAEPPVEVAPEPDPPPVVTEPGQATLQLPALNASDGFVATELRGLGNGAALVRLLAEDQIIRKFVVLVENISRGAFPQTGLPYKALGQEMPVRSIDENLFVMDQAAHSRFDGVVDTLVALDTDAAMALYRALAPLLQQAYAEIGFGDSSFDQTLQRAIGNVLDTPDIPGPYQLVKPSVMYLYADAGTENLQEMHKQLIRIGPANTRKLKAKLREFLARLQA